MLKRNNQTYMNFKEIKSKSESELAKLLGEFRETIRELRFKDANKQLKKVTEIREARKTVARILTHLSVSKKTDGGKNQ